jgi:hypothetical protein
MIHLKMNTKIMLITPIWPITTLDGNFERVFAAFITDGPKNEEPRPAIVKLIERITMTKVWLEVPTNVTPTIPAINESPESRDALTTRKSIV